MRELNSIVTISSQAGSDGVMAGKSLPRAIPQHKLKERTLGALASTSRCKVASPASRVATLARSRSTAERSKTVAPLLSMADCSAAAHGVVKTYAASRTAAALQSSQEAAQARRARSEWCGAMTLKL